MTTKTTSQRLRALLPLPGRPVLRPRRREVLDDALLGTSWQWDAEDRLREPTA